MILTDRVLRALLLVTVAAVFVTVAAEGTGRAADARDAPGGRSLAAAIATVNAQARKLHVDRVTARGFREWYRDQRLLAFVKTPERSMLDAYLAAGKLPPGYRLRAGRPARIDLVGPKQVMDDYTVFPAWTVLERGRPFHQQDECRPTTGLRSPCTESFRSPLPSTGTVQLPSNVPVDVTPIRVPGTSQVGDVAHRDALAIQLFVTAENVDDIVAYFGVGFRPRTIGARLRQRLSRTPNGAWMALEDVLGGWLAHKANSFPRSSDNDVCHGPARQFFNPVLRNGELDRSTEATEKVLHDGYRLVPDGVEPRFGDYLYLPGLHSARFMLKDPGSGRWIGFSVQSGGESPYRFWWVDEDFSGRPFEHVADPGFLARVDVWRRGRTDR